MPSTATRSTSSSSMTLSREISPTHSRASPPLSTLRPHCPDVESPRISSRYVTSLVTFRALAYASGSQITREGALNIVRQAVAASVKNISFLETIAALLDLTNPLVKAPLSTRTGTPSQRSSPWVRVARSLSTLSRRRSRSKSSGNSPKNIQSRISQPVCPGSNRLSVDGVPERYSSQPTKFYRPLCGRFCYHSRKRQRPQHLNHDIQLLGWSRSIVEHSRSAVPMFAT